MNLDPKSLVEGAVKIPTLPTIFYQINEAVEDPECSFSDIARLISGDPSLSARLLQLANSAFFGFPSQIETVTHAITIIGMAQLRDLVLATNIVSRFKKLPEDLISMERFWQHCIACGLAARIIAIYRKEPNAERFYVLGMLHDLGRLVLFLNNPGPAGEAIEKSRRDGMILHQVEKEILGFDHADVGGELMKAWKLPGSFQDSVLRHHDPSNAGEYSVEASILHVADLIAHALQMGHSGNSFVPPLDVVAWENIDLPSSLLGSIIMQMDRQFPDAIQMFLSE